jgi:membrane-associated protease RseP (regulator of RpoE activity)
MSNSGRYWDAAPPPAEAIVPAPIATPPIATPSSSAWQLAIVLFLATCASTLYVGTALVEHGDRLTAVERYLAGAWFALPMMLILLCHEMGHFLAARWHGIAASPPYFIPFPFNLMGTLGAVIIQPRDFGTRRTLFDITVAGPLAGLIVALPVVWFGVQQARLEAFDPAMQGAVIMFGDPLILQWIVQIQLGTLPEHHDVVLNPLLFAGWAGLFLTGLNLLPLGQLDGGHLLFTLIGKPAFRVGLLVLAIGLAYMVWFNYWVYALIFLLAIATGIRHAPTRDDSEPLGPWRTLIGWTTMALFFVCFTPFPFVFG